MRPTLRLLIFVLLSAVGISAPRNSPGLPFGEISIVAPKNLEAQPVLAFMPSPASLQSEFEKRNLTGEVLIGFTISPKGKPEGIKVLKSSSPEMAKLAMAFVSRLVFRPARSGGSAVASEAEMPFFVVPVV